MALLPDRLPSPRKSRDGRRRAMRVGCGIEGEIEVIEGAVPSRPVMIRGSRCRTGREVIVALDPRSRRRDWGRMWGLRGRTAGIRPVEERGSGR